MRFAFIFVSVLLTSVPSTVATTCDSSVALSWPTTFDPASSSSSSGTSGSSNTSDSSGGSSSSGSSTDACAQECGNDSACLQTCLEIAQQGECNSVGCSDDSSDDTSGSDDTGSIADDFIKRDDSDSLDCSSSQDCYLDQSGVLGCIDFSTGDFIDQYGGTGNVNTNDYTAASGQESTASGGQTVSSTTGSATSQTEATELAPTTTSEAATTTTSPGTSSSAAVTGTSDAAAQATGAASPNLDMGYIGTGLLFGALGLIPAIFC